MPDQYTTEDEQLAQKVIDEWLLRYTDTGWLRNSDDLARTVLAALSSSGRLLPPGSEVRERIAATAETLHVVAGWGDVGAEELHRVAQEVAAGDVAGWTCCPVCEEIECDAGCPLAPVRSPVPDTNQEQS